LIIVRRHKHDKVEDRDDRDSRDLGQACDTPTDILGRALGDIGGRDDMDAADGKAGDGATDVDEPKAVLATHSNGL
jgi:hypothetical protein